MDGVAAAIIGFILVCIIFPDLIKNRHQYYMALAAVLLGMLVYSIMAIIGTQGAERFARAFLILLEAVAVILLVMASGGLSARQFAGNMARGFEVMRRGEDQPTTIIPLPGQVPGAGRQRVQAEGDEDEGPRVYTIDDPSKPADKPPPPQDSGSIPLE